MTITRRFRVLPLFLALALASPLALAADAQDFIKAKQGELGELVRKGKTPADDKKLEAAFDEVLDYDTLARESLKDSWNDLKPEERTQFQDALKKLVRSSYRKSLRKIRDYDVAYSGETKAEAGQLVRTVAKSRAKPNEEPLSIDYVVRQTDGKWRIVDIVTEGSSLVGNYRNQFRRIIKKQGFPELLRRMKTKLDKGDTE